MTALYSFPRAGGRLALIILLALAAILGAQAQTVPPDQGLVADTTELRVLRQFYYATNGPQWWRQDNWLRGTTLDQAATWYGVTVSEGDVVQLVLRSNNLHGPLPASLGLLTHLQLLHLSKNHLTGPLPEAWGTLTALADLDLAANELSGDLPAALSQCTRLSYLNLARNRITGSLRPLADLMNLSSVNLIGNQLSGPLPAELWQLPRLIDLDLSVNQLTGPLPPTLGARSMLQSLSLSGNRLTGTLPAAVLTGPALRSLRLADNELTGIEELGGTTGRGAFLDVQGNRLGFASLERLYQGPGQARLSYVDARGQRAPERVDTATYQAGGPLVLDVRPSAARHVYRYQWQRLVAGEWVSMPGDTLATKRWEAATAAEQGTYRRAERNRWFTNRPLAPTELYSVMVYADLLPYAPLARNRPDDANRAPGLFLPGAQAGLLDPNAPVAELNFVRTWTPREALTDSSRVPRAPVDSVAMRTVYLDGLGRPVQTVQHQASPQRRDLVQPQAYDALGREPRQYLPYPVDSGRATAQGYHEQALDDQAQFYLPGPLGPLPATDPTRGVARTGVAYAETLFEPSPLNRVLAQAAPGESWQLTSGHAQERLERPNMAQDSVPRFVPGYGPQDRDPGYQGYYAPGELWGVQTTDEQTGPGGGGYATIEWKDKQGQTVLRQVEGARTGSGASTRRRWLRTAYVYDDFGRKRYVLQPEATKRVLVLGNRPAPLPASAAPFLFHYRYDARGREIAKQVPGTEGETWVVYDQLDRPVLSQDAAQRGRREWSWSKYDVLGRVVLTGLVTHAQAVDREALQALADATPDAAQQYEQRTSNGSAYAHFYTTDQAFPRLGQQGFGPGQVLTVTYYDDYNFDQDAQGTADVQYNPSLDGQFAAGTAPVADVLRTTGLVTRTKTRVLGVGATEAGAWLTTSTFYDERARPVQVQATNARGGLDLVTTRLNFSGQPVQTVSIHEGPNHAPVVVREFFSYDHAGRLVSTSQQLPGEAQPTPLARVGYNELGQSLTKTVGTGRLRQEVDYAYNIRGWLTSVNNPYAPDPQDLFSLSLHYERGFTQGYEQYNGNLTGQTWRGRDGVHRAYGYVYDPLNRLLQGDFVARTGGSGSLTGAWRAEEDRYRLSFVSYDDNGNIATLRRRGLLAGATRLGPAQYGPVDALTYRYAGNRLLAVDDQVTTNQLPRPRGYEGAPSSLAGDFQEGGTHLGEEYVYDANGSLTQDRNKGISGITYNHLSLPRLIHFGQGADSLVFRYSATGQKVAKLVYQTGKPVQRTDYLGPYQYEQDSLRFFPHAEGRVLRFVSASSGAVRYEREYTLKDHLGNLRLAYRLGQMRTYVAGLEPGEAERERRQFDSLSVSPPVAQLVGPRARSGQYAAKLNAGGSSPQPLGALKQLAVQRGDTVSVIAPGLYPQAVQHNVWFSLASFLTGLLQPSPSQPTPPEGVRRGGLPLLQVGVAAGLAAVPQLSGGVPRGYVRLLVFDADSSLVSQQTQQLTSAALNNYESLRLQVVVPQDGYVSAYVGNESNVDVFFDDVTVEHRQGLQVQETQYDPTGLELAGLTREMPGLKPLNQYRWNGKEFQADLGLNWTQLDWRMYDAQLNDTHVVDPEVENGQESLSPYAFSFDNAVRFNDPNGRYPGEGIGGALMAVADFTNAFVNAVVSNATTLPGGNQSVGNGVPRVAAYTPAAHAGQVVGDLASVAQGIWQMGEGAVVATTGAVGGVALAETGVGAVAGFAVAAGGAAVAAHGANTAGNAMHNLLNSDNGRVYARPARRTADKPAHNNKLGDQPAEGYTLRDRDTKGVNKFGETTNGESKNGAGNQKRYSNSYLEKTNSFYQKEVDGTKTGMHKWQTEQIRKYKADNNGQRPPLNKSDY
ncbi:hypothetical protein IC235_11240 [Hymenobacter sp. BT664]|uniref:DUF6443 domain-containing protein n=1 Tax=Hymenobacter montanus TaxID=2771359 RepID=A0A927BE77_9BACT|nr:DUF6443 domain-containing protein [Hymenobacter montanus]MBD2768464.1 hypothetical protein [Hymenobacter montanus]